MTAPPPAPAAIRPAVPEDVGAVLALIRELASYERAAESVTATEELLAEALFGQQPAAFCHVAEVEGTVVGFALWFVNFSTWLGRPGLYLEDLFVRPEARGAGLGRALLAELAAIAVERGYGRLDWAVLTWNAPAIRFYRSLGAQPLDDWVGYRLTGEALRAVASNARARPAE